MGQYLGNLPIYARLRCDGTTGIIGGPCSAVVKGGVSLANAWFAVLIQLLSDNFMPWVYVSQQRVPIIMSGSICSSYIYQHACSVQ